MLIFVRFPSPEFADLGPSMGFLEKVLPVIVGMDRNLPNGLDVFPKVPYPNGTRVPGNPGCKMVMIYV